MRKGIPTVPSTSRHAIIDATSIDFGDASALACPTSDPSARSADRMFGDFAFIWPVGAREIV